jgi:Arc-like DNA binding domain
MARKPARHPDDEIHLKLRLSERLRRRLENAASKNSRSMNSEIIHRLEGSFQEIPDDVFQVIKTILAEHAKGIVNNARRALRGAEELRAKLAAAGTDREAQLRACDEAIADLHHLAAELAGTAPKDTEDK